MVTAVKFTILMSLLTGIIYPLCMTGLSQVIFPERANGSFIVRDNKVVGSELIAQKFVSEKYFWPRPSAVDYNPMSSGASNLGPISADLVVSFKKQSFASGSGLDPHITPDVAKSQIVRVSKARGIAEDRLLSLINGTTEYRQFGVLGEERVNVLKLNLALDELR